MLPDAIGFSWAMYFFTLYHNHVHHYIWFNFRDIIPYGLSNRWNRSSFWSWTLRLSSVPFYLYLFVSIVSWSPLAYRHYFEERHSIWFIYSGCLLKTGYWSSILLLLRCIILVWITFIIVCSFLLMHLDWIVSFGLRLQILKA